MNQIINTVLFLSILFCISCTEQRYPDPLAPEKALESFQLRDGFEIELFASEPHVLDPVEMVFDEQGNAYVAEMPDYPFMPENGKGAGRIRVLRDTNGDGRIDDSSIFADSILEATSMLPWKGGLIVTAAPHILYLKDTDGDLRADEKEILFTGFFENNSEAQITSLRFGIDNWIYAANNGQAGTVHFTRKPEAGPISMSGADFRFRLDRNEFEQESGGAQFGLTMDDWGHRFITQNTLHIRQVVIPWRYTHRHPHLASTNALINVSDHDLEMFQQTPPPYWRAERTRRRQIQYKEQNLDRVEYAEDHFTGSSGGTVYDGDAFPPEYYGNIFTGEVAGNLVHRDVLVPLKDSPAVVAKRDEGEKNAEFLASTDSWFRPSGFAVGPDGFLYVIDMYRQHIETPLSIPEDLKENMDFLAGSDMGRIYRIVPENAAQNQKGAPNLRDLSSLGLLKLLTHNNRWWRLQAQRLLLERQDASVVPSAKELFATHADARVRLHALYVLEGLNGLTPSLVENAMKDPHGGVRKHGLILSERYPELLPKVLEMLNDTSVHVVFQATLTMGGSSDKKVTGELARIIQRHGSDPLFRTAVLSAKNGPSVALLDELIRNHSFFEKREAWKESFLSELSYSIGSSNQPGEINSFLNILALKSMEQEPAWQVAGINGLKKGLQKSSDDDSSRKETLKAIQTTNPEEVRQAIERLKNLNQKRSSI
jgi:putative membrane-bound dehydrogenase-like protein